jgi:hypothetical protein
MSELAEPSAAPDGLQRPLLRRVCFQPQVSASVRHTVLDRVSPRYQHSMTGVP